MNGYAFLDLETSGLNPFDHEIIEVGYILLPDERDVTFSVDFDLSIADPKALEVNGWGKREFPPARSQRDAAYTLADDLKDRMLVINNPAFDVPFLRALLGSYGLDPTWHYHPTDIKAVAGGMLGLQPPWHKDDLSKQFGVEVEAYAHTALDDARWNYHLWLAVGLRDPQAPAADAELIS